MEKPAATGCYKCGRPGHWSRDCPSSSSSAAETPNFNSSGPNPNPNSTRPANPNSSSSFNPAAKAKKVAAAPKTRPKLTPELLLSDDNGLGYILRHFPKSFKYRGRGHEVRDLGNLIGLYSEWHSKLIPYYSFDQFVHKVEQVAATKHVKMSLRELRERVARGGDLTKMHEPPVINEDVLNDEQGTLNEGPSEHQGDPSSGNHDVDFMEEDMLNELDEQATEELPSEAFESDVFTASVSTADTLRKDLTKQVPNTNNEDGESSENQMTDEQRARTEASRLKALEKAADRLKKDLTKQVPSTKNEVGESQLTDEQRARIEANRLKALEKAAARRRQLQVV